MFYINSTTYLHGQDCRNSGKTLLTSNFSLSVTGLR